MIYFGENIKIDVIPQESGVRSRLAALHFENASLMALTNIQLEFTCVY